MRHAAWGGRRKRGEVPLRRVCGGCWGRHYGRGERRSIEAGALVAGGKSEAVGPCAQGIMLRKSLSEVVSKDRAVRRTRESGLAEGCHC